MQHNKRDILIIDEPFQFKYSLLIGLAGFFSCVLISLVVYNYVIAHDKVLLMTGINQSPDVISYFNAQHKVLVLKLASMCVVITLFMFLLGLVISNRIAGPIFSIRRRVNEIVLSNDLSLRFFVRKKDEFKDLTDDLNKLMNSIESENVKNTKTN